MRARHSFLSSRGGYTQNVSLVFGSGVFYAFSEAGARLRNIFVFWLSVWRMWETDGINVLFYRDFRIFGHRVQECDGMEWIGRGRRRGQICEIGLRLLIQDGNGLRGMEGMNRMKSISMTWYCTVKILWSYWFVWWAPRTFIEPFLLLQNNYLK